jgi:hypothetical protein
MGGIESTSKIQGVFAYGLGCFEQAAIRVGPTTDQKKPVLYDHGNQFGIELAQDAPRLLTAPFIDLAMAFPQLE